MTREKQQQAKNLEIRKIQRDRVIVGLSIAAAAVVAVYTIGSNDDDNPDGAVDVSFYQTTAQCEADVSRQHSEYASLQQQYQASQLDEAPEAPQMLVSDCAPQMLAAQQQHDSTAPVYPTVADCQAEGVQCEATPANAQENGYRPIYGGTYIDTYDPTYTYIMYGGRQYQVHPGQPVYQSMNPGSIVTPYGREIAQSTTGRVSAPRHTTFALPARPTGTSAIGTIRGRSSQGFGSSFKSSGDGGK